MRKTRLLRSVAIITMLAPAAAFGVAYQNFAQESTGDQPDSEEPESAAQRKLTDAEIKRLRYMELRALRVGRIEADTARVQVPRSVIDEFMKEMEGREGFRGDEDRRGFLRQSQEKKLAEIALRSEALPHKGAKYIDRIEIRTDPDVFQDFRHKVMPHVLRGCASTACHGGARSAATGLRLFDDPKKTTESAYTNFLLLDEIKIGNYHMIDRDYPERSLLLTWMLPPDQTEVKVRHPGDAKIKPQFLNTRNTTYQTIKTWIEELRHPHPEYGVRLHPAPPATQPAEAPETQEPPPGEPGEPEPQNP